MLKTVVIALVLAGFQAVSASAAAQSVKVGVKGMVCSFCAQGITKKFSKEEAVGKIDVSLENHLVSLQLKDGKSLTDERITQLLKDAGYSVEKIERQ